MAIKSLNKINTGFSMASLTDVIFLLLIFFLLTSTFVSPHAIKMSLPDGKSRTIAKQSATVYISENEQFYVNNQAATPENLEQLLTQSLIGENEGVVVIRSDKTVDMQYVVQVMETVDQINKVLKTKHKIILATQTTH